MPIECISTIQALNFTLFMLLTELQLITCTSIEEFGDKELTWLGNK
jgi:hypothetical protein